MPDMYFEHTQEIYEKICTAIEPVLMETNTEIAVNVLSMIFVAHLVTAYRYALQELEEDTEDVLAIIRRNINVLSQQQRIINIVEEANREEYE